MPLIIDGYNVLRATMPPSMAGLDEGGLCRALGRSAWRGQRITVVCDGSPKPRMASESPQEGVELRYSGPDRTADDVILELLEADTAPRRLVVVSNDRQLQKAAYRRRARVLSSEEFIHALTTPTRAATDPAGRAAGRPLTEREVDQWLEQFGFNAAREREAQRQDADWPPEVE